MANQNNGLPAFTNMQFFMTHYLDNRTRQWRLDPVARPFSIMRCDELHLSNRPRRPAHVNLESRRFRELVRETGRTLGKAEAKVVHEEMTKGINQADWNQNFNRMNQAREQTFIKYSNETRGKIAPIIIRNFATMWAGGRSVPTNYLLHPRRPNPFISQRLLVPLARCAQGPWVGASRADQNGVVVRTRHEPGNTAVMMNIDDRVMHADALGTGGRRTDDEWFHQVTEEGMEECTVLEIPREDGLSVERCNISFSLDIVYLVPNLGEDDWRIERRSGEARDEEISDLRKSFKSLLKRSSDGEVGGHRAMCACLDYPVEDPEVGQDGDFPQTNSEGFLARRLELIEEVLLTLISKAIRKAYPPKREMYSVEQCTLMEDWIREGLHSDYMTVEMFTEGMEMLKHQQAFLNSAPTADRELHDMLMTEELTQIVTANREKLEETMEAFRKDRVTDTELNRDLKRAQEEYITSQRVKLRKVVKTHVQEGSTAQPERRSFLLPSQEEYGVTGALELQPQQRNPKDRGELMICEVDEEDEADTNGVELLDGEFAD